MGTKNSAVDALVAVVDARLDKNTRIA
jgi:hypothetical protein